MLALTVERHMLLNCIISLFVMSSLSLFVLKEHVLLFNSNLCITDAAFIELTRENEQHKDELTLHGELITDI